jgi:hypothetical protein
MYNAKLLGILFAALVVSVCNGKPPRATVTVHVTDSETHLPVPGALAGITFTVPGDKGAAADLLRSGLTDANGDFRATDNTMFYIGVGAQKTGYYKTGLGVDLQPTLKDTYGEDLVVPILLKPIVNPIAMYARKRARLELPIIKEPVGFDLLSFDWLPPYGKGVVADFLFTLTEDPVDKSSKILSLNFSNVDDGIVPVDVDPKQGSALRLPRTAPEAGYEPHWVRVVGTRYAPQENRNYFYRIRTVRDGTKIRSALYGKIYGDIGVDIINSKTALIFLTYYLNPDGSRNVEFDPNRNLFKQLPPMAVVRDP